MGFADLQIFPVGPKLRNIGCHKVLEEGPYKYYEVGVLY